MNRIRLLPFVFLTLVVQVFGIQQKEDEKTTENRVDEIFLQWDNTRSPGCTLAVIHDGQILYKRAYGMADLDHDVPLKTESVFHVASVSKQFTAAAVVLLAQEGKLSLDDPIQKHLPEVPQFDQEITIRHLVHHTSGLRDQWSLLGMAGWRYSLDLITDEDVMSLVVRQRDLNFPPGERYLYSNTGYTLMGQIVKKVSGQSLREFTSGRIFGPLGMRRTHFRDDHAEIVKDQAIGYSRDPDQSAFRLSVTNFDTVGATSLLTTVEDMAHWAANFHEPRVGGAAFLEQMHQRGKLNSGEDQDYAFGLVHGRYRGLRTVSHGGADAGYRSHFLRFPDQGYSFVSLCNLAQTNPGRLVRQAADIYLEGQLEAQPEPGKDEKSQSVPLAEAQASRILGTYWSDQRAAAIQIESAEEGLQIRVGPTQTNPLVHLGEGLFQVVEMELLGRFEPLGAAPVERLIIWPEEDDGEENQEKLEKLPPFEAESSLFDAYAGSYQSPEIDPLYRIELKEGKLAMHRLKREPSELTPVAKDLFVAPGLGSVRFQRNPAGDISGFILDSGRIRNFWFGKIEAPR